jgi:hypothetical protein
VRKKKVAFLISLPLIGLLGFLYWEDQVLLKKTKVFGENLISLCTKFNRSEPLSDIGYGPKFLILREDGKRLHKWHIQLNKELRAETADEVRLLICVGDNLEEESLGGCSYTGGGYMARNMLYYQVFLIDPATGRLIDVDRVEGRSRNCQRSMKVIKGQTDLGTAWGDVPNIFSFKSWLETAPNRWKHLQ